MTSTLYQHQKDIIAEDKKKVGLFLGTGSGKTLTASCLAKGKTLVIAPKTQKEDMNWEREADKNKINVDLTVMSKETFRRDAHLLPPFDTIIVDEAHTVLGVTPNTCFRKKVEIPKTSQLFEELDKFIARTNPERIYLCTATIMRSPMTVWGAGKILGRKWDYWAFRSRFYIKLPIPRRDIWVPKTDSGSKDELARIVKKLGYVGRLEDYFDVPAQTHKTDYIDLTDEQKRRIKEMRIEYPDVIVRVGKIHQIENGTLAGDEFNEPEYFPNNKLDKIFDYSLEFPRMIVFAKYTEQIHQIAEMFIKAKKKVFILNGATKNRGELLAEAKKCDNYVFIAQASVSSGWELPDCPTVIFASRTYSFVDMDQALGRVQRSDNIKKNLYIYLVTKGGTDEAVHKALLEKKDFSERLYAEKGE